MFMFSIFAISLISFSSLASYEVNKQKLKFRKKNRLNKLILTEENLEIKEIDSLFQKAGITLKGKQYQIIRFTIISLLLSFWVIELIINKQNTSYFILAIIIYVISIPKEKYLGIRTPFYHFLNIYSKEYQKKKDIEIYNIISQIKNIHISTNGDIGVDYILEQVLRFSKHTKPMFLKFISLWNINKKELAVEQFSIASGSQVGIDLANFLYKFDNLKGEDLIEQLNIYQNKVRQEKETLRNKSQERKTNILYFISIGVIMLILVNMVITIMLGSVMQQFELIG